MKLIDRTKLLMMVASHREELLSEVQDLLNVNSGDVAAQFFSGFTFDLPSDGAATVDLLDELMADVLEKYQQFERDHEEAN